LPSLSGAIAVLPRKLIKYSVYFNYLAILFIEKLKQS
jgi:hypothetical protein